MTALSAKRPRSHLPRAIWRNQGPLALGALIAVTAIWIGWKAGVRTAGAAPDVGRGLAAALLLFGVCGYPVARMTLPTSLREDLALFAIPVGAATSALALTVLGFLGLPLAASVALVFATGATACLWLRLRHGPGGGIGVSRRPDPARVRWLSWAVFLLAIVCAIALIPTLSAGFATTTGDNGDAVLATGVAQFLQETPPGGENTDLYVDRMPANWRSKYAIYYAFAGVAELSGLAPTQLMATLMALMLGLVALGFALFARHALGAGPVASLLVLALVPLDRIMVFLAVGPYYNQMWGLFAFALILLFGLHFLRYPGRGSAALLALFAVLGAFAYPLMLAFPFVALSVAAAAIALRDRREGKGPGWLRALRLPRGRRSLLLCGPAALLVLPAVALGLRGVLEKISAAALVILPGSNLAPWSFSQEYVAFHRFFGLVDPFGIAFLGVALMLAATAWACWRAPREVGLGLLLMTLGALAFAAYFKMRYNGSFFYFKILSFLGPVVVALAVVALVDVATQARARLSRIAARGVIVALSALFAYGGGQVETSAVAHQLSRDVLELREWSAGLPTQASVLIHMPSNAYSLWAQAMLAKHPVSTVYPFAGATFPTPPQGFKADYVLGRSRASPPGAEIVFRPAVHENGTYRLWRMRPHLPGVDASSRETTEQF